MRISELDPERLGSVDQEGRRINIHPAEVKGRFQRRKSFVYPLLIVFFLVLPWIHIGGEQWFQLNVVERKFNIFGLQFWATDTPLIFFCLLLAALGLVMITALYGRVWCGWACPQTVFIDGVFRKIEAWIEGDAVHRRRLDAAPWSAAKLGKKISKWLLFVVAGLIITHSFLAYFVGSKNLLVMIQSNPLQNWGSFLLILVSTTIIVFDFGWFQEQFCVIMCPYGRFQSIMMDPQTRTIMYNPQRGEPRRGSTGANNLPQGDCINCYRCVEVCPTKIDIRRGTQLECIGCSNCADACDDIMAKTGKPAGLIGINSSWEMAGKKINKLRPRVVIYLIVWVSAAVGLIYTVANRRPLEFSWTRPHSAPYIAEELYVTNSFTLHARNQTFQPLPLSFTPLDGEIQITVPGAPLVLKPGEKRDVILIARFPKTKLEEGSGTAQVNLTGDQSMLLKLLGPFQ